MAKHKKFGRTKDYTHQIRLTYGVPLKSLPFLDWMRTDLSYDANYGWKAASINTDSLGNVIQNGQTKQVSGELDFSRLYNKSPFLAKINKPASSRSSSHGPNTAGPKQAQNPKDNNNKNKDQNNPKNNTNQKKDQKNPKDNSGAPDSLGSKDMNKTAKDISNKLKQDKVKSDSKKPSTAVSPVLKAVIRPLLLVRKFRVNY